MKSLFSCFYKTKNKSKVFKNNQNNKTDLQLISDTKSNEQNHCNGEIEEDDKKIENNVTNETQCKFGNELENHKEEIILNENEGLNERLKNALLRIENVYTILNNKCKMYLILSAITDFKMLIDNELNKYVLESDRLDENFYQHALYVVDLFNVQSDLLSCIQNRIYTSITSLNDKFQDCVIKLNTFCTKKDDYCELRRLIADSIMIFGWMCCLTNPSNFTINVLDGSVMVAAKLVNDPKFSKYSAWIKSWATLMKAFHGIITKHFEVALMWRLDGPIPMDIMKCLIQCNYSNVKDQPIPVVVKPKVVKTTAVNDISYETVTSLFDDLRSGKQKSKLRCVKPAEANIEELTTICIDKPLTDCDVVPPIVADETDRRPYTFANQIWTISNQTSNADIEIPNKDKDNSVSISDCTDCSIQIDGTIKDITIKNCSNINVIIDEISGLFLATDSANVESQVLGTVVQVDLRTVNNFRLFIAQEGSDKLAIVTRKCTDIDLYVSNNDAGGLELEDYDRHVVGTQCRSGLVDGVLVHTLV